MNTKQALDIINMATQPNVRLTRANYVQIEEALKVLAKKIGEEVKENPFPENNKED